MSGPFEQARNDLMSIAAQAEVIAAKIVPLRHDGDNLVGKITHLYGGVEVPEKIQHDAIILLRTIDDALTLAARVVTAAREQAARLSGPG